MSPLILFLGILIAFELSNGVPCIPKDGLTALFIGQDFYSITNYTTNISIHSHPFGVMSYTSLVNKLGQLEGLVTAVNYGSGIEWTYGLVEEYPVSAVQIGLWLVNQTIEIAQGKMDSIIDRFFDSLRIQSETSFYVRIGYEFDYFDNNYDPVSYVQSFQRIVNISRSMNVSNAAFVWHSSALPLPEGLTYDSWFPGHLYVDVCGVSLFTQPYSYCSGDNAQNCSMIEPDQFASYCRSKSIPLMIAESTPKGGIDESLYDSMDESVTWRRWFEPVLSFIDRHNVSMWCYINCNWDAQPMWKNINATDGPHFGDTRLEAHPKSLLSWKTEVLENPRFLLTPVTGTNNQCKETTSTNTVPSKKHDNNSSLPRVLFWESLGILDGLLLLFITTLLVFFVTYVYQYLYQWLYTGREGYVVIN